MSTPEEPTQRETILAEFLQVPVGDVVAARESARELMASAYRVGNSTTPAIIKAASIRFNMVLHELKIERERRMIAIFLEPDAHACKEEARLHWQKVITSELPTV